MHFPEGSHSQHLLPVEIPIPPTTVFCCSLPSFCAFLSTGLFLFMILIFDVNS